VRLVFKIRISYHLISLRALIATIKDMGACPCPRCLTPKRVFSSLGLLKDMKSRINNLRIYVETNVVKARQYIYQLGHTVDGTKVEDLLGEGSWVPVAVSVYCPLLFHSHSNEYPAE
jgi:hypothetical protein